MNDEVARSGRPSQGPWVVTWVAFVAGIAASLAANVAHANPTTGARFVAGWAPLALLLTIEVMMRVPPPRSRALTLVRYAGTIVVAGVAAIASFRHMRGLALAYGEDPLTANTLPLSVDGLVVTASIALLTLADRRRASLAAAAQRTGAVRQAAAVELPQPPAPAGIPVPAAPGTMPAVPETCVSLPASTPLGPAGDAVAGSGSGHPLLLAGVGLAQARDAGSDTSTPERLSEAGTALPSRVDEAPDRPATAGAPTAASCRRQGVVPVPQMAASLPVGEALPLPLPLSCEPAGLPLPSPAAPLTPQEPLPTMQSGTPLPLPGRDGVGLEFGPVLARLDGQTRQLYLAAYRQFLEAGAAGRTLSGREVGQRCARSERWGRDRIAEVRAAQTRATQHLSHA